MKRMLSCLALLAMTAPAVANDRPINDKIVLRNLDTAFEEAAADLKMMTAIYGGDCTEKSPASCSFEGEGTMEIRGIAATADSPPSNISITYKPDGNPVPFGKNIGFLVSICEPQLPQSQRGKIIASIMQVAGKKKPGPIVEGKNADYAVTDIGGVITVVAEKAAH